MSIASVVEWSLARKLVVVLGVVLLSIAGIHAYRTLPVDAVPDVTGVQVQVLTNAPGLSPLETEALVSRPVELAMAGLPGAREVRSISRSGVSAVTIVFDDGADLLTARALVAQRLASAREAIPASADRPELGPLTTALGEVYHFTLRWPDHPAKDLRTLVQWDIAPALLSVPGVVEVNPWGGAPRQIEVRLRGPDMRALGVSQRQVESALLAGGQNAGGGALERKEEQILVRFDGQYRTVREVESQVVGTRPGGVPILVRDVATVVDGEAYRASAATADGEGETIYVMVQMIAGGNAHEIVAAVKERLGEVRRRLPAGVSVEPFYDRASLVDRVLATVQRSLIEGGAIVILVLFFLLGNVRAGLVVATAIPLAMLGAFTLMKALGISGNLMSLGAIDFGLVVDGAVVIVEGALATMAADRLSASAALAHEGRVVGRPLAFGVFIVALVYIPVLFLEGVEGKMFRPMALVVLFALGTALVLSFTWIPVAAALVLRKIPEGDPPVIRWLRRVYEPVLATSLARPVLAAAISVVLVGVGAALAMSRGAEFVPRLEEGDLVIQTTRPPSVSIAEAVRGTLTIEETLRAHPEVARVVSRTGSPDVATDVMGIEQSDVFVILKPRSEWKSATDREALVEIFDQDLRRRLPGTGFSFTQPIEMRVQELLGGLKSDVGVKVFGEDIETLTRIAGEVARTISEVPGAEDVRVEPTSGLPLLTIAPSPSKMGRLGVATDEVRAAVEALRAGRNVGSLVEGERRFPIAVRLDAPPTPDVASLATLPLTLGDGRVLPLGDLCDIRVEEGPAQISREHARRRILVEANIRGRDLGSFVTELKKRLEKVELPPRYYFTLSGQYENLVHAAVRFAIIVPATLVVIFVLLYLTFGSAKPALLIFLNVPVAASGGVVGLWARDLPFSISAAVGFIALFGVATLNGVVLMTAAMRLREEGLSAEEAMRRAARVRFRPVLTTAVVASIGFLPMALAHGTGAEVQRPLATVVIGGLGTATLLTLAILPALYTWLAGSRRAVKQAESAPSADLHPPPGEPGSHSA